MRSADIIAVQQPTYAEYRSKTEAKTHTHTK